MSKISMILGAFLVLWQVDKKKVKSALQKLRKKNLAVTERSLQASTESASLFWLGCLLALSMMRPWLSSLSTSRTGWS